MGPKMRHVKHHWEIYDYLGSNTDKSKTFRDLRQSLERWNKYCEHGKSGRGREGDHQSLDSLAAAINELGLDWFFLEMLWQSIYHSDADKFVQSEKTLAKIRVVADEVNRDLSSHLPPDTKCNLMERSQELLDLLVDCKSKTDELMEAQIRQVLMAFKNPWSFDIAGDGVLGKKLLFLSDQLKLICFYLAYVYDDPLGDGPKIDAILSDASSVIVRIVVRYCNLWFNRQHPETANAVVTEIVDLLHEIAPTNPEFIQLNLRYLKSLCDKVINSRGHARYDGCYGVTYFSHFLLNWRKGADYKEEQIISVRDTITLCFDNIPEDGREDMDNFFAEIVAVLAEVAFFFHGTVQTDVSAEKEPNLFDVLPLNSELQAKLCLLKAELFLKQQLNAHTPSMLFSNDQFFSVNMIRTYLKAFKYQCQHEKTEFVKESLVCAEKLADDIVSLKKSLHSRKLTSPLVKHSLLLWLFRIAFFKAEACLAELLKCGDASVVHEMHQINYLAEELTYFKGIIKTKLASNPSDDETVMIQMEGVVRGITLLSYSYLPDNQKFKKIVHSLPQLLVKMNNAKAKLREIIQQFPKIIFPKTFELGFFDFLCRNLRDLLKHCPVSMITVKHHIQQLLLQLESFKSFLVKVKDSDVELGELEDLGNHIIDVAYKLEFVIDSIEVEGHLQQSVWLYDLLQDIRLIDQKVQEIREISYVGKVENLRQILSPMLSRDTREESSEMLVGLVDEEKEIIDRLTRGSLQRDAVSIVGMPGSGKTTLARKVYHNPNVTHHFYRRAWCTVSQTYTKRELLLELLGHIDVLSNDISKQTDDDLMSKLRRCLLRNKYLIVMDDVWDTVAWNHLQNCFPDDSNGSRILITSRRKDIASEIKPGSNHHSIRPFSDVESWKLLKNKIFEGADWPEVLAEVGIEIAQQCQGLPLAVVTIAGLLKMLERNKDSWTKVFKSLSSEITSNPENRCRQILELSYKNLPAYLKACFIYLGVFHEDKDIPVTKLSFCVKRPHFVDSRPSGSFARSLTFFASPDSEPKCPYDMSFICHNFKLLRILDLEAIMAISFPAEIGLMIQLRYLAVSGYMKSVPPSISKLWRLETLVVKGLRKVILPETVWSMKRLRHLHVNNHVVFSLQGLDGGVGSSSHLEHLVSLSTPSLSCKNGRWRILKRFPNLRKLRCIFWQSENSAEENSEYVRWNFLTHLESLKIICFGGAPNSGDFLLPQCLQKLTLIKFCLQENHLSVIAELPNLRVLKLRGGAFEGHKWELQEEEFQELTFLELDTMNLAEWNASYDHFPRLERLVLRNCKDLKRIPSDFAYIPTMQKVEVHWCGKSVEESAEEIGVETQEIRIVITRL
ncbi:OLC1v1019176C1 [Oldenlandia corymbosa var. corymbosa]|uniref:OLC1v1019176C1 n=1 Tax=Oldenlandia corymbosa var. corymbosa TaxID=529605 RepID=A0AAV1EDE1_OLDCO|nr:OLC1v1019176C1 [Oldenlandia corymbosa var. corymbosa]